MLIPIYLEKAVGISDLSFIVPVIYNNDGLEVVFVK